MSQAPTPAANPATNGDPAGHALAAAFGLAPADDLWGPQSVAATVTARWYAEGFVAPLPDLGLLSVGGDEAASFLHSQLTNDVEHLPEGQARWYGYCTAKGRMLGSFLGWREPGAIRLAATRTMLESLRKRLTMFVLRAKVRIDDASGGVALLGLGGEAASAALEELGVAAPASMHTTSAPGIVAIGLPPALVDGAECERWLLAVSRADLERVAAALGKRLARVGSAQWRWTEVRAGVARIVPATSELFVPQMVNYELVDGVSFTKGCYPGQEVVARSHYLGKLKRRMFAGHVQGEPPAPAADVFGATGDEPCGQVVMAAPAPQGGADLLFECRIDAAQAGGLRVGEAPLTLAALPYAVPANPPPPG